MSASSNEQPPVEQSAAAGTWATIPLSEEDEAVLAAAGVECIVMVDDVTSNAPRRRPPIHKVRGREDRYLCGAPRDVVNLGQRGQGVIWPEAPVCATCEVIYLNLMLEVER